MSVRTAPAPAAALVRLTPAPVSDPPYDRLFRPPAPPAVHGLLAPAFAPARCPVPRLCVVRAPAARGPAPDAARWGTLLARGIVEVVAGDRPVTQLVHWTAPDVYEVLCRRALAATSRCTAERVARPRAIAGRVHVCRPADDVAEVTSVVHARERAWALAFRLEARHGRWLCTELLLG